MSRSCSSENLRVGQCLEQFARQGTQGVELTDRCANREQLVPGCAIYLCCPRKFG